MILVKNVPYTKDGQQINLEVEIHTRGGSKSPELHIVRYNGRRIVPYRFDRSGLKLTLNGAFKLVYRDISTISNLVYQDNPLLKKVSKNNDLFSTPLILKKGIHY